MSQFPLSVYAGMTNSSPTPGAMLKRTPGASGCSGRGASPCTYASDSTRCGAVYGERAASRSNRPTSSPLPAATMTRSYSSARWFRSEVVTPEMMSLPPRSSSSSDQPAIFTRWSMDWAG